MDAPASVRRRRAVALVVVALAVSSAGLSAPPVVSEEMMLVETDALARAVGEARKVRVLVDWQRRLIDRAEARADAEAIVRGSLASARPDTEADAQVFRRLGLLPSDARYVDLIIEAVARDPVGFYDPVARRLSVPSYIPLPDQRSVLAHEIAHALQDQRVGLRRFLRIAADGRRGLSFDGELARQAVVEGDAAVLALEAVDPRAIAPAPPELGEVVERARAGLAGGRELPSFLRALLAFPTVEGFGFVARARGRGTWATVDGLWTRPPESTAQILHPERYERRLAPLAIELPALPLMDETLHLSRADTFGELLLRLWLAARPPGSGSGAASPSPSPAAAAAVVAVAERAAAGWRGDRMAIYVAGPAPVFGPAPEPPPLPPPAGLGDAGAPEAGGAGAGPAAALAWLTAWDSDADADDFLQTAAPRLAALAAASAGAAAAAGLADSVVDTSERPAAWRAAADDAIYAIERRGTLVALLLGAPAAALPSLTTMLDGAGPRRGREDRARRARDPGRSDQGRSGR